MNDLRNDNFSINSLDGMLSDTMVDQMCEAVMTKFCHDPAIKFVRCEKFKKIEGAMVRAMLIEHDDQNTERFQKEELTDSDGFDDETFDMKEDLMKGCELFIAVCSGDHHTLWLVERNPPTDDEPALVRYMLQDSLNATVSRHLSPIKAMLHNMFRDDESMNFSFSGLAATQQMGIECGFHVPWNLCNSLHANNFPYPNSMRRTFRSYFNSLL